MKRVLGLLFLVAGSLVMGGGDCGGGSAPTGCSRDSDCVTGAYCRTSDGQCYSSGFCDVAADCADQPLTHSGCTGSWSCASQTCGWTCAPVLPGPGEACGLNSTCAAGLTCLRYYGIGGPSGPVFSTCEKACRSTSDCSAGLTCVNIVDGPGQVCRLR